MFIDQRDGRCHYCFLPTERTLLDDAKVRACSDACERALYARLVGWNEKKIAREWNAAEPEERRPGLAEQSIAQSGERPTFRWSAVPGSELIVPGTGESGVAEEHHPRHDDQHVEAERVRG